MKQFKKVFSVLLTFCLLLSFAFTNAGCDNSAKPNAYTVRFYEDSESDKVYFTQKVEEGESVDFDAVPAPEKAGYEFGGWTQEKGTMTEYPNGGVTGDLSLYAIWHNTVKTVIRFVTNGAGDMAPVTGGVGDPLSLPKPDRGEGWAFGGWYIDEGLKTAFTADKYPAEGVTLYAKWNKQENYSVVTFLLADGTLYKEVSVKTGTAAKAPAISLPNYVFLGWKGEDGEAFSFNSTIGADMTLTADYYSMGLEIDGGEVVYYEGESTDVIVPRYYRGEDGAAEPVEITAIAEYAFHGLGVRIRSVSLPDSIVKIGEGAFMECASLEKINIPASVTDFGEDVFLGCEKLADKTFEGNEVYRSENGLMLSADGSILYLYVGRHVTELTLPATVTTIKSGAFVYANVEKLVVPATVTQVEANAFDRSLIRELAYRAQTENFPSEACKYATLLTKVTLGDAVAAVGNAAFDGCVSLGEVCVEGDALTIGQNAFRNCSALSEFAFGKVTAMAAGAFGGAGIVRYEIPAGTQEIAPSYFSGWSKLKSVTIPSSVQTIGKNAFFGCIALESISFEANSQLVKIDETAFYNTALKTVDLTACTRLKEVGEQAFALCRSLIDISFPKQLAKMGAGALKGCERLENLTLPFAGGYSFEGFYDFFYGYALLPSYQSQLDTDKIPTEQEIEEFVAAYYNDYGKAVYAASKNADRYAEHFKENCFGKSMLFGYIFGEENYNDSFVANQYSSKTDYYTFYLPGTLKNVTINGELITAYAFNALRGYTGTFTLTDDVREMGAYAFYYNTAITEYDLSDATSLTALAPSAFSLNAALLKVTLPDNITSIGSEAFYYCRALREVRLPACETLSIGYRAFGNDDSLVYLYTRAADRAEGDANLGKVALYTGAFTEANALKRLTIADGSVMKLAFYEYDSTSEGITTGYFYCAPFSSKSLTEIRMDLSKIKMEFEYSRVENGKVIPQYKRADGTMRDLSTEYLLNYRYSEHCIPSNFFSGATALTTVNAGQVNGTQYDVVVPEGVDLINYHAFWGVPIRSIYLPQTLQNIGGEAFNETKLEELDVSMVQTLGAFGRGTSVNDFGRSFKKIILSDELEHLETSLFAYLTNLHTVQVRAKDGTVYGAEGVATVPSGAKTMGSYLYKATKIRQVDFSRNEKLTEIGPQMCYQAASLQAISIPENIQTMANQVFEGCTSLAEVSFEGEALFRIGNALFRDCASLEEISLPEGLIYVGSNAFSGCTQLRTVVFPSTLQFFSRSRGFENCKNLRSIVLTGTTPCQIDSAGSSASSADAFYNSLTKESDFDKLVARKAADGSDDGLKIYVPAASAEAYRTHAANSEQNTLDRYVSSAQTSGSVALRPEFGWNRFKSAMVGYDKGVYAAADGSTVGVMQFEEGVIYLKESSAYEKLTQANGSYVSASGKTYTVEKINGVMSVKRGNETLLSIGGTYLDHSYTANNPKASDANEERLIQFRPQLVLGDDGKVQLLLYRDTTIVRESDTTLYPTRYKLYVIEGTYTVGADGIITVTLVQKYSLETSSATSDDYAKTPDRSFAGVTFTIGGGKSQQVNIDNNTYTFDFRG